MDLSRRILPKCVAVLGLATTFLTFPTIAQELPESDGSFEVEPPVLIPPLAPGAASSDANEAPASIETLQKRLGQGKEDAAAAIILVKKGVLAKVEAEQRALRVLHLDAELAKAQRTVAEEQVAAQKKRLAAGQSSLSELDIATAALTQATARAETALAAYEKARLEGAERDLRRQRKLRAQGSARKSDVTRAEEKLAALQQSSSKQLPSPTP